MLTKTFHQLFLIGIFITVQSISAAWVQDRFIIGSLGEPCNSAPANPIPQEVLVNYQTYKNAYFNLTEAPGSDEFQASQAQLDYVLEVSSRVGIRCYVQYFGVYCGTPWFRVFGESENPPPNPGATNTVTHYQSLTPAQQAALDGYYVGHEPVTYVWDTCLADYGIEQGKLWTGEFADHDPDRHSFTIALPSSISTYLRDGDYYPPRPDWENYLDSVYNDADSRRRPQVVCADHYAIMGYNESWIPAGSVQPNYFWGLNTLRQKAQGRPFWVYILAVGHGGVNPDEFYINPDENHLRFQIFCSIAYGAKGIRYFSYLKPPDDPTYHDAIINDCDNTSALQSDYNPPLHQETRSNLTKYEVAREINRYVSNVVGPVVMSSDFINAYHKGGYFDPTDATPDDPDDSYRVIGGVDYDQGAIPLTQVLGVGANDVLLADLNRDQLMAGVFRDKVNQQTYYLLVVNKKFSTVYDNSVMLKGDFRNKVVAYPRAYNYDGSLITSVPSVTFNGTYSTVQVGTLAGGEGRLIKVTGVGSLPIQAGFRPQGEIAVTMNAEKVICFARGTDNKLWYRRQEASNTDYWGKQWTSFSGTISGNIVTGCLSKTNRLVYVFSRNSSNCLRFRKQTDSVSNAWEHGWLGNFNTTINSSSYLCASRFGANQDLILFFKRNSDGKLWYYYASNGSFNISQSPVAVPGSIVIGTHISAEYNPGDGSVDVFVTDNTVNRRLYRARMTASRSWGSFTAQNKAGGAAMNTYSDIAIGMAGDNRLKAFAASGGYLWQSYQISAGGSWSVFHRFTIATSAEVPSDANKPRVSIGRNPDGRLEVFARGNDDFLKHIWEDDNQCLPCGCWSCTLVNSGSANASITIGKTSIGMTNNQDGRLVVFAPSAGNENIFFTSSIIPPDPWDWNWQPCIPLTNLF